LFASPSWSATAQGRLAMTAQLRDIRMLRIKDIGGSSAAKPVTRPQKVMNG
jgi:hypothetical protein